MPRVARSLLVDEGSTNHCSWRSQGNAIVFDCDEGREYFLGVFRENMEKYGIKLHSYMLMGTHPHVVVTADKGQQAFSAFWKVVNWKFARWYNARTSGRGQVIMERMTSPRIQDGRHQLVVMRYGDLNPVRAGLVGSPKDWKWSSYRHYAFGEKDDLITDAPEYLALGPTPAARRKAYQALFARPREDGLLTHRRDLVSAAFIGDPAWIEARHDHCGLSPPRRR